MRKLKLPGRDIERERLEQQDIELIRKLGIDQIREHAEMIVKENLRDSQEDDQEKVPKAGNPVYKAMHACNAASREQLFMAHRIRPDSELTDSQLESVVDMLMRWIVREYNFFMEEKRERQQNLGEFA
ncbi:MAG: DUF4186 family protein [Candidatus Nanohaloarchaea archaeon]